jgi:hypothetical protein
VAIVWVVSGPGIKLDVGGEIKMLLAVQLCLPLFKPSHNARKDLV